MDVWSLKFCTNLTFFTTHMTIWTPLLVGWVGTQQLGGGSGWVVCGWGMGGQMPSASHCGQNYAPHHKQAKLHRNWAARYTDVIMTTITAQFTSPTVVYSTVYSDADQRKHKSSASLAFPWGIHRDRWIPRTKGQLRGKCFHLMTSSWKKYFLTRDLILNGSACRPAPLWPFQYKDTVLPV